MEPGCMQSHVYTEALSRIIKLTVLWDDWEIVTDIIMSFQSNHSRY